MCKRHKLILGYADPQCRACYVAGLATTGSQATLTYPDSYAEWRKQERERRIAEIRERMDHGR